MLGRARGRRGACGKKHDGDDDDDDRDGERTVGEGRADLDGLGVAVDGQLEALEVFPKDAEVACRYRCLS
jgi:hypothetical protein